MAGRIRAQLFVAFVGVALIGAAAAAAQSPSPQDRIAALKQSLAENQAALRQYTWIETTTISLKGEVKKQEQKQCSYGADGKVQKTPLPGAPAPAAQQSGGGRRGGRVKKAVVEKKVDELKDYMERAAALVHQYVPPDAQKIQAAQAAGHVSVQPSAANAAKLTVKDYLKPGDSLAIGLDTAAKQLSEFNVSSYVDKPKDDDLTLAVTFARLPDGTSFPQKTVLDVTAKKVQVTIANSGYKKAGS
jgi:hypothetical protein